jgi:hypothetical protein
LPDSAYTVGKGPEEVAGSRRALFWEHETAWKRVKEEKRELRVGETKFNSSDSSETKAVMSIHLQAVLSVQPQHFGHHMDLGLWPDMGYKQPKLCFLHTRAPGEEKRAYRGKAWVWSHGLHLCPFVPESASSNYCKTVFQGPLPYSPTRNGQPIT